ncbi:MAG: HEAT repeat domain-containing protein [Deltaproteobacteria bacterium]|nr:HEAT repeat domain-containing protein [Deltaproteobacteria bacterium]
MTPSTWAAIGNTFAPFDPVPPSRLDQWFVERPNRTAEYLVRLLSPERLPGRHILVGQPASGKSSELTKLAAELQKQYDALVVRFDMTDNTDVERANPVEVLFLMGAAIFKVAAAELPKDRQPDRQLLENLKGGLETLVQTHTANTKYMVNLDKLLGGLVVFGGAALAGPVGAAVGAAASQMIVQTIAEKFMPFRFTSGTNTQVVRKLEVEPQIEAMVEVLNQIIDDVRSRTDRPLILLVDGLDKLRDVDVISLNFLEKKFLNSPAYSVLYTGPLDLYYSPQFGEVRTRFPIVPFPHVKLHARDNHNQPDDRGYDVMQMVVFRRLESLGLTPQGVIADEALAMLITGSGGVMRDLIRLIQSAALQAEIAGKDSIEKPEAAKALNELRRQLMAQLTPEYHEVLQAVRSTHQRVDKDDQGEKCDLLIVVSPDVAAERALVEEVRLRLGDEVAVEEVTFAAESVERLSLSHHLSTLPPRSGKAAVFVFGLDDLPPDARTTALKAMNWGRERLRWSGYTIVLWVRPGTPGDIGNGAPDFFSWRSDVFEFDWPSDPVERQQMLACLRLFAPATLNELRRRYCDYVMRTYQWLDFRGLLQLRNVVRLPLDEVFVPLQATTTVDSPLPFDLPATSESATPDGRRRYELQRLERRVALNDAARQHRHLVVLGDPGSGKSTLLRFLALVFAQGRQQVQERLGISEDRLPILVPLSAFAEARQTQPDLPLAAFLPRYFLEQGLPDFSPLFEDALSSGRTLALLDGLDEMLTANERTAVARAVIELTSAYPTSRVVVTSRIAGYAPGMLPAGFTTFTVAPLDDEAIKQFAKQWSLAFESIGLPSHSELSSEARRRALLRADSLVAAATGHPGVRRLATNPLLLTLLALIHHQGTRLPNRRTDLYRLCVEALAETWNLARSLSGRPIDLRLGERRLDEEFVVHILAPVTYWMHENKPTGLINREELEARVVEQFAADGSAGDARMLARDFVNLVREQMGLLVERAPDEFSFLHLSIQEYLAARFLSERKDGFERLKPRLHHPRWREVVLLTAGCLRGDYAAGFIENILNAHGSFDNLLQHASVLWHDQQRGHSGLFGLIQRVFRRDQLEKAEVKDTLLSIHDLLLAARCLGDGVPVQLQLSRRICDALFALWRHPPFAHLRFEITPIFSHLNGSGVSHDICNFLLTLLGDRTEERGTRWAAASALEQVGRSEAEVVKTSLTILRDKSEDRVVRSSAASALGRVSQGETEVVETLLSILGDGSEDGLVRQGAAAALGQIGRGEAEVVTTLLTLLRDKSTDPWLLSSVAIALGQTEPQVVTPRLAILQDRSEDGLRRWNAAFALEQLGQGEPSTTVLLDILQDKNEYGQARDGAAWVLGKREASEVVPTLLHILQDQSEEQYVREQVARALGRIERKEPEVIVTLLNILQNKSEGQEVRRQAASALANVGQERPGVVTTLFNILRDKSENQAVRKAVAAALGQVGQGTDEIIETLLQATDDPPLRDTALGALWDVLPHEDKADSP